MALFAKKKRTLEEIIEEIKGLSPDEQAELASRLDEAPSTEEAPAAEAADAEPAAEPAPEADVTPDGSVGDDAPDTEPADEPTPEVAEAPAEPVEDTPTEDNANEALGAMAARLATIEENYNALIDKVEAMAERLDGGNFGNPRGVPPEGNEDANGEESPIISSYYRKQSDARRT